MKYRVKTKIDDTDRVDMIMVQGFFGFLAQLTEIKVINDEANRVEDDIDANFCGQCEMDKGNCDCNRDSYYERDWDRDIDDERNNPRALDESDS